MAETKITKNQVIPFLDISGTINGETHTPQWARIDRSTIFDLALNPNSQETDYISLEAPIEEVDKYKPELPQEIALYRGNKIYDFVEQMVINLPVGDAIRVPALICFPPKPSTSTPTIAAWQVLDCRLLLSNYNSVDGKITFTLKLGGDIDKGTVTITEGVPTFTKASA